MSRTTIEQECVLLVECDGCDKKVFYKTRTIYHNIQLSADVKDYPTISAKPANVNMFPRNWIYIDKFPQAWFVTDFCSEECAENFWSKHSLEECETCDGTGYEDDGQGDVSSCLDCNHGYNLIDHADEFIKNNEPKITELLKGIVL